MGGFFVGVLSRSLDVLVIKKLMAFDFVSECFLKIRHLKNRSACFLRRNVGYSFPILSKNSGMVKNRLLEMIISLAGEWR